MKLNATLGLLLVSLSLASSSAAEDNSLSFTLDEVEGTAKKPVEPAAVNTSAAIAQALGDVRWGMSKDALLKLLKQRIREKFDQRIKGERNVMRQDQLYHAAQEQARRLSENYVSFDGRKTGWDVSPIAGEFVHGIGEAMLVVVDGNTRDLYFFQRGKLWKWYRELTDQDSDNALSTYRKRFGKGSTQRERLNESKEVYMGLTWTDTSTRLSLIRRGRDLCLIFEANAMLEQIALERRRMPPAKKTRAAMAIDSILLNDAELKERETRTY